MANVDHLIPQYYVRNFIARTRKLSSITPISVRHVWQALAAVMGLTLSHPGSLLAAEPWPAFAERHSARGAVAAPAQYPTGAIEDRSTELCDSSDYAKRRQAYLKLASQRLPYGIWDQLLIAEQGLPVWEGTVYGSLLKIDRRLDCADFVLHGILRLLYQFDEREAFSSELIAHAERTVLDFKYWPDEPGTDSMCTWSENHYILFASAAFLAGQRYPDQIFTNSGVTGKELAARHRLRVLRWLDLRYRTGFSEWLSHVYYEEDIAALLNLVDFCEEDEIVRRATMVLDLIFADIACNSFHGCFSSTHGRSYEKDKKTAGEENTSTVSKLCFGTGRYQARSMSGTAMALSTKYSIPQVLCEIANHTPKHGFVNRQRMGIRIDQAEKWGLGFENSEDGMHWLTMGAYAHPQTMPLLVRMLDEFQWWENRFFQPLRLQQTFLQKAEQADLLDDFVQQFERDLTRNIREEVNIYTYRTQDYMLSTAQDYRPGFGGDQHSIWQATLGPEAICFTTHPVIGAKVTPNYWTGSGMLPRAAQRENVAIVIYNLEEFPALYVPQTALFTHAWLPKHHFDEIVEREKWIFARRGEGYLALWASQHRRWGKDLVGAENEELIAEGRECVWICELGSLSTDGSFEDFISRIAAARVTVKGLQVAYESPTQGLLELGWTGPFTKDQVQVSLKNYPRYQNSFASANFPATEVEFNYGTHTLKHDWNKIERTVED